MNLLKKEKLPLLGGALYCFSIALFQQFATLALVAWAVLSVFSPKRINKDPKWLLLPLGLFVTYALSFVLAPTDEYGILERKLSLVMFPLIFYLNSYNREERKLLLKTFLTGLVLSGLICLVVAFVRSLNTDGGNLAFQPQVIAGKGFFESIIYGGNYFFGRHFSFMHQTVYYAMYLCIGVAILLYRKDLVHGSRARGLLTGFFIFLIFLISNKAGFLVLSGVLFLFILQCVRGIAPKLGLLALLIGASMIYIKSNPRFQASFQKVRAGEFELNPDARYGFSTRLLSWDASLNLIADQPFHGYGVAHAQEQLDREYERLEYAYPLKEHLNAHNQFIQFWIESGFLGFAMWGMVFILLLLKSVPFSPANRQLVFSFIFILFVNSLFESVLNRFSGISVISFALCFIFSMHKEDT